MDAPVFRGLAYYKAADIAGELCNSLCQGLCLVNANFGGSALLSARKDEFHPAYGGGAVSFRLEVVTGLEENLEFPCLGAHQVGKEGVDYLDYGLESPEVFLEVDHFPSLAAHVIHNPGEDLHICSPEEVDRLLGIADNEELALLELYLFRRSSLGPPGFLPPPFGQQVDNFPLELIGILKLVHEHDLEPAFIGLPY